MSDCRFLKKLTLADGVSVSVYVPTYHHSENQNVVLAFTTYTRDGNSVTTTSVTLNEDQTSTLADALNGSLGHAWPKEF